MPGCFFFQHAECPKLSAACLLTEAATHAGNDRRVCRDYYASAVPDCSPKTRDDEPVALQGNRPSRNGRWRRAWRQSTAMRRRCGNISIRSCTGLWLCRMGRARLSIILACTRSQSRWIPFPLRHLHKDCRQTKRGQTEGTGESQTTERRIQFANRFSSEVVELAEEIEAKIQLLKRRSEKALPPIMTGKQLPNLLNPCARKSDCQTREWLLLLSLVFTPVIRSRSVVTQKPTPMKGFVRPYD